MILNEVILGQGYGLVGQLSPRYLPFALVSANLPTCQPAFLIGTTMRWIGNLTCDLLCSGHLALLQVTEHFCIGFLIYLRSLLHQEKHEKKNLEKKKRKKHKILALTASKKKTSLTKKRHFQKAYFTVCFFFVCVFNSGPLCFRYTAFESFRCIRGCVV